MHATLASLPVELLLLIAEAAERNRNQSSVILARLCQTCKAFDDLCSSALYRSVTICSGSNPSRFSAVHSLVRLLQALHRRPHLGACMRILHLPQEVLRSHDLIETAREEAEQIICADNFACKAALAHPQDLGAILAFLTLRFARDLTSLSAPSLAGVAAYWPTEQRLVGTAISRLELYSAVDFEQQALRGTRGSIADRIFQWPQAFRPGKTPTALQALRLDQSCPKGSDGCYADCSAMTSRWISSVAAVRHLEVVLWCDCGKLAALYRLLASCPLATNLSMFASGIYALTSGASCFRFAKTDLATSELDAGTKRQSYDERARDPLPLTQSLHPLHLLKHLTHIHLFMHDCLFDCSTGDAPDDALTIWPPALEGLSLSSDHCGPSPQFMTKFAKAVRAGCVPSTLASVGLHEWCAWATHSFFGDVFELFHLADSLVDLKEACAAKEINLFHRETAGDGKNRHSSVKEAMKRIYVMWCGGEGIMEEVHDVEDRARIFALTGCWYWGSDDEGNALDNDESASDEDGEESDASDGDVL